jgi:hypothetical protein
MREDLFYGRRQLAASPARSPSAHPRLVLLASLLATAISAGLCAGAMLASPPTMVVPVVVLTCVGAPMFAGWEAPGALAALRAERAGGNLIAAFRRRLQELPETEHPLGL